MKNNVFIIRLTSVLLTLTAFFSYSDDKTMLTIENCKNQQDVSFTMPALKALRSAEITTLLPWKKQEHRYLGVYLENIIKHVDGNGLETIHVHAKNDYSVQISGAELQQHKYMLAYAINDEMITRRQKGPLVLMRDLSRIKVEDIHELDIVINLVWFVERIDINCGIKHG
ncbi:hypothetical protein FMO003_29030 [Moritella sp. F3]|nr:hypothetical protein FMO001_27030 [Moritella sp. F1]GIC82622.1 hypothetical protein FMO003_29030 [Moritella sp. F3]